MALVIGVDEAGYGPNLGPLAIGVSVWQVQAQRPHREIDLYKLLARVVANKPHARRLAVADSKQLYKAGGGLTLLERGVLAMLASAGAVRTSCFDTLVDALAADGDGHRKQLPWHQNGYNPAVPLACTADDCTAAAERLVSNAGGARLVALRARLVFPAEFNSLCEQFASKGMALSHWTLALLRTVIDDVPSADLAANGGPGVIVTCDKHGGRNNYAGLLGEYFPQHTCRVIVESRLRSAYLLEHDGQRVQVEFRTQGEAHLETALASMVAKYLRELSMHAFNAYWQAHVPNLKPTAGYPVDSRRFKRDIAAKQGELGIDDRLLWRER